MSGGYTALLAVSQATYDDIHARLEKLGYSHTFNHSPIHGDTINMSELSITVDRSEAGDKTALQVWDRRPEETDADYIERLLKALTV